MPLVGEVGGLKQVLGGMEWNGMEGKERVAGLV